MTAGTITLIPEVDGAKVQITIRARRRDWTRSGVNNWEKKTRVYVSHKEDLGPIPGPSVRGDGSDEDKAWRKYNRAELAAMNRVIAQAMPWIVAVLSLNEPVVCKFSRRAGCSCPCSPGFIADRRIVLTDPRFAGTPVDIDIKAL